MHKLILLLFKGIKHVERFLIIVCVFLIMMMSLYWIQDASGNFWGWMTFCTPLLDTIITSSTNIFTFKIHCGDMILSLENAKAILFLCILISGIVVLEILTDKIGEIYENIYCATKKIQESIFNKQLESHVYNKEKGVNKYLFYFRMRINKSMISNKLLSDSDIEKQKRGINKFIQDNIPINTFTDYADGILYQINDFESVDNLIEILKKIQGLSNLYEYIFCIQIGDDKTTIKQLIDLQIWNKVVIAANTLLRYNYNKVHRYKTSNVGVFQKQDGTIEVHEFNEAV